MRRTWIDEVVVLAAPLEEVSTYLADIRGWPSWVPGLLSIRVLGRGPVTVGTRFSMIVRMPPVPPLWLPNQVFSFERDHLEWGGGLPFAKIRHSFHLEAVGAGVTRLRHQEYATNFLALVCRPIERAILRHDSNWTSEVQRHFAGPGDGRSPEARLR